MVNEQVEFEKMAAVEERHWWFRMLHARALRQLRRRFGNNTGIRILDCGCGTGGFLLALKRAGYSNITGFDLSVHGISFCKERGLTVSAGDFASYTPTPTDAVFDVVVLHDVIAYSRPAELPELLRRYLHMLAPGGILLLNTAVGNLYRGMHDVATHMAWRPEPEQLHGAIARAGGTIVYSRRWPLLLAPAILATRALQRRALRQGMVPVSDVYAVNPLLNALFLGFCRLEQILPARFTTGSSLYLAAERRLS